ncbi:uncharacterized protein SPAPADRAFT_59185 [Spathaspora passalidarum NRRL Y-27907]|uniref:Uncharacterized protein n=1 Tax=Spathaspora passalidarum (strain NRRL Y-27907 / 11-Y1) TaxID=619300 RepID=G3AJ70_SPAPN|nr:uncharacterized protein SPAPADRAFT_59185 [Spathaspora passalidarum NRRL Y-27907]EGW33827.1 hypothetical protein SPAPADRAFT_59185 [Spathaspora passalidarum NRRL Y-27907]
MLRTTIIKSTPIFYTQSCSYSVLQQVKGGLSWANIKIGKAAAKDIEIAERAAQATVHSAETAGNVAKTAASTLNKTTGKVLAGGIEVAEEAVHEIQHAEEVLNKGGGKVLAEGIDLAQTWKHHHDAVARVRQNKKGYTTLQEKGAKVETEQNRPDDGL